MIINFIKSRLRLCFKDDGFSLLEVMIATVVVSIGLVGAASLIVQNIQAQYINKTALIASQLAQEGLELVRNQRDANWLDLYVVPGDGWKYGRGPGTSSDIVQDGGYAINYDGDIIDVDNIDGAPLFITDGFYTHNWSAGSLNTPFKRLIEVTEDPSDNFITVKCRVRTEARGRIKDYIAETVLYKWR